MRFTDLRPTPVYDIYWEFAVKRQDIFFNRLEDKSFPWTDDEILNTYKFTNASFFFISQKTGALLAQASLELCS